VAALLVPAQVEAALRPSSDQLLPYFEVDFDNDLQRTTLFAVCNDSDDPVKLTITVFTNWGIPVLTLPVTLDGDAVLTVNLRDWIVFGKLPGRTLSADELAELQDSLSGRVSRASGMFHADEIIPGRAVGYITFRVTGSAPRPNVLWGDYFVVDPKILFGQGETLVDLRKRAECGGLEQETCLRHGVRFLTGGPLDESSELMVWTARKGRAANRAQYPDDRVDAKLTVYDEAGNVIDTRALSLLPVGVFTVGDLDLPANFGWFAIETEDDSFITAHYTAQDRFSLAIHAYCIEKETGTGELFPGIHLEKRVNGSEADLPPGVFVAVGAAVQWTYEVTNTGDLPLSGIVVTDDDGVTVVCPGDVLVPGESMTCTASGVAEPCQQVNTATATGFTEEGEPVTDVDPSHYYGEEQGTIDLEKLVNGQDADTAPGPSITYGAPVTWTYAVTNTGPVALGNLVVSDDQGVVPACPKTSLAAGESMNCEAKGTAIAGPYKNVGTAVGKPACGPEVSDTDPAHYLGSMIAGIRIKKATNGADADLPTGPFVLVGSTVTWTYLVTNIGNSQLTAVAVTDDKGVAVACPKTVLQAAESMTCTASGVAVAGQYANVGTATGKPPVGANVTWSDPSHYFGAVPKIAIEKLINGDDADLPPGPTLRTGNAILWTYVVTNTGNVQLTAVAVSDDKGVAVTCPKATLVPGESMTCTGSGVAVRGQYVNVGTATGTPPVGPVVTASDPSHYVGQTPAIGIVKSTNGEDANSPPGPILKTGANVTWTYLVTNTGDMRLTQVAVTDDKGVTVTCPKTVLEPGESMTCTASGKAVVGQYKNIGTATGLPLAGPPAVTATDPSHYYAQSPKIWIKKYTNGKDADSAPGPYIEKGNTVNWTYIVTNEGDVTLSQVTVTDDKGVTVTCPKTVLTPGESMTCTASGKAVLGQYKNIGTATGQPPVGPPVSDTDPSHYYGKYGC
jgi:hypothetical protein